MATLEWEPITKEDTKPHGNLNRGRVFGGWIVRYYDSITFVPDTKHNWK